ncbi:MAG TPA: NUDIX hydrolase [Candidatus Krumholzibacteria bacterium]|nr:NUDIX hydrolase [Candidatus Krumholzibacteria bacterium]HPD72104.1 NUDIX hydrolase [Candidatus Krumholzibacteria bacterium]HRY40964.1 NUDIX hydrolase [Candidatus Krumholzibacteria bacterium]
MAGDDCLRPRFRNPALTVDGVVLVRRHRHGGAPRHVVLLVERREEPFAGAWALPGGFVEYGEDPDQAVCREVAEETGLEGLPFRQFRAFGRPDRDPRGHTVSIVYVAELVGEPPAVKAGDDAAKVCWFPIHEQPPLAFDHDRILDMVVTGLGLR